MYPKGTPTFVGFTPRNIAPVFNVRDFGATGNGTTDDTEALQRAIDAAEGQSGGVVLFPKGTYNHTGLAIDASNVVLRGVGRNSELAFTPASGAAVTIGSTGVTFGVKLDSLLLTGPGSGTGKGIDASTANVKNGLHLVDVALEGFGGYALHTVLTDYMTIERVRIHNNLDHGWYAGASTYATTVIGGAFGVAVGFTPTAGKAGVYLAAAEGVVMIGTEFGRYEFGLIIPSGSTSSAKFVGCRFEGCLDTHAKIGDSGTTTPNSIDFENCTFLGDSTADPLVVIERAERIGFTRCRGAQVASGGAFIQAVSTLAKVTIEECVQTGGSAVFKEPSGAGRSSLRIAYGGDGFTQAPLPFVLCASAGTIAATATIPVANAPRGLRVKSVWVTVGDAVAADASNYWALTLSRYTTNGVIQDTTGTLSTASTALPAYGRRGLTLGAGVIYNEGESFVLAAVKTGAPADLARLVVSVQYEPIGLPPY